MKDKKEIIKDLLEHAEESLVRVELRLGFVQNKHVEEGKKYLLEELAELTANKKGTEEWVEYLKSELAK